MKKMDKMDLRLCLDRLKSLIENNKVTYCAKIMFTAMTLERYLTKFQE